MSGVGPVEPGEGTRAWDTPEASAPEASSVPPPPPGPLAGLYARHRRTVLASTAAVVVLAGGGYLYATRPEPPTPPAQPYPSQVVEVVYLGPGSLSAGAPSGSFGFEMELVVESGPPVTVERMTQPYAGLALTSDPRPPFRTESGHPRKIVITMSVTECGKVPENAGLPFLDVTLRNVRAIQVHSFILGERYARDLSDALQVACSNDSASSPKT
ncbi:Tat pathway signal sequence domain protein [Streptomyces tailanensis]|uniref:Tat pathway signal sequence domain protein n=1 Tax=Streptomyces tailanensis TaxID=2569858 RepID=UPI00122E49BB|nr:Tat pathway signal sequence domain protein [Streptomyces tailanensis]